MHQLVNRNLLFYRRHCFGINRLSKIAMHPIFCFIESHHCFALCFAIKKLNPELILKYFPNENLNQNLISDLKVEHQWDVENIAVEKYETVI